MTSDKEKQPILDLDEIQQVDVDPALSAQRDIKGLMGKILIAIGVVAALYGIYTFNLSPVDPWIYRAYHVLFLSVLGFAYYPGWKKAKGEIHWVDLVFMSLMIAVQLYIVFNHEALIYRSGVNAQTADVVLFSIGTILLLELTRRTTGMVLPTLALLFVAYAFLGPYLPGILHHNGYSYGRLVSYIYGLRGIFSVPIDVSAKYVLLFIIFGSFLQKSGVGSYFVEFAFSTTGKARGGPAKAAVISSALMGMINGTAVGNVVTTGSLTIPLMKKLGYRKEFAGATEAVASTGGQIMPPIMGAGVFIMAEITGIPYSRLILAGIIPAILYFASVYFMVDYEAIKLKLFGYPRSALPPLKNVLKRAYLFLPIFVLVGTLVLKYSVIRAGTFAIISSIIVSWLVPGKRLFLKGVLDALDKGARATIQLMAVCASAGIVMGVITLTGIGGKFSFMLLKVAGASEWWALGFAMLICIVLGMGMPTTAAYAVAASVVAPGLIRLGISPLVAHMFVFYFAVISTITPPVALSAFAGAAIAGSDPMRTGVTAFRLGLASFIVPFMFYVSPEMLWEGNIFFILFCLITGLAGVFLLASAVQGWFVRRSRLFERIVLFGAALLLIFPTVLTDIAGIILAIMVFVVQRYLVKEVEVDVVTS